MIGSSNAIQRQLLRQEYAKPIAEALRKWLLYQRGQVSEGSAAFAIWLMAALLTMSSRISTAAPAAASVDPGVRAVFWQGAWLLYSDFTTTRYRGSHRLPRDTRRHIARWLMFLRSSLPYEWPLASWRANLVWLPAHLLTLGLSARLRARKWRQSGDYCVWPFRRWSDYRAALRQPVYLRGRWS